MASGEWFDELYIEFHPHLLKTALRLTPDAYMAEDLVQYAFTVLYEKREELINHPNIKGWLVVAVKNRLASELQKTSYTQEISLIEGAEAADEMDQTELYWEILSAGLPKEDRLILELHYRYGYSYAEIGKFLGCSDAACRMRAHRSLGKCRDLVKNEKI